MLRSTSYAWCNVPFSWHGMKACGASWAVERATNASLDRAVCTCQRLHFRRPAAGMLACQHCQREAASSSVDRSKECRWSPVE